jgi:hypothetical protein
MPAKHRQQIAGSGGHRCAAGVFVLAGDGQDDAGSLGGYDVRTNLIHVKNHTGDVGSRAVLGGSDLAHAIRTDGYVLGAVGADCVRKVQQDAVRILCGFNRGFNRSSDRNLDP